MSDVLSDVLRTIHLKGALFLNAEFHAPWCVRAPSGVEIAEEQSSPHQTMAVCHLVVEGQCWVHMPGQAPIAVYAGEVITLPYGDAHLLGCGENNAPASSRHAVKVDVSGLSRHRYGGQGTQSVVICGWFAYDNSLMSRLMAPLPRVFSTDIRQRPAGAWLESAIAYAVQEASSNNPGSKAIADKLAEVLFVEALRGYIESSNATQQGWLAGLRDPVISRCLSLMHEHPARNWTVATLAQAVNVSRSLFAERFSQLIGMPPMQYLTHWRVALAGNLLRNGQLSLSRIAEQVGYESEAAFSRAFKREYGVPPGTWRRNHGADHTGHSSTTTAL